MRGLLTVIKKELRRFFTDRRLVLSVILPGILVYVIYSLMGTALNTVEDAYEYKIAAVRPSATLQVLLDAYESGDTQDTFAITAVSVGEIDEIKQAIKDEEYDLLLVFSEGFDSSLGTAVPSLEIYYNGISTSSSLAYSIVSSLYDQFEDANANLFDINRGGGEYDLATEEDASSYVLSMMLPMLIVTFIFSGCLSVTPESIAGEKERGTMATVLVTPVKRSHVALGKIVAISCIASISAISSFLGVAFSLPALTGLSASAVLETYGVTDLLWLLINVVALAPLLVSAISIISAYAKTVKEASSYSSLMMILVMIVGVIPMFGSVGSAWWVGLIPVYNGIAVITQVLSLTPSLSCSVITLLANVTYVAFAVLVLTRMFNSEKIMFTR